jgi:hypothetical protein
MFEDVMKTDVQKYPSKNSFGNDFYAKIPVKTVLRCRRRGNILGTNSLEAACTRICLTNIFYRGICHINVCKEKQSRNYPIFGGGR